MYWTTTYIALYELHFTNILTTVEPMSNDHPHQWPSLLYDHILCDGQCFRFVRSLTNNHPSNATNDRIRWNVLPRGRPIRVVYFQESRMALQHPPPMVDYYNVALRHIWSNSIIFLWTFFYFGDATTTDGRCLVTIVTSPPALRHLCTNSSVLS